MFNRLVLDGRQVGIHVVLTADRRGSVNALVQSAIANRIVLRQSEESGYTDHGIPMARARGLDLRAGPGAVAGRSARAVRLRVRRARRRVAGRGDRRGSPTVCRSPTDVVRPSAPHRSPIWSSSPPSSAAPTVSTVVIGLADLTLDPVSIDLDPLQRADRRAAAIGSLDGRGARRRRARRPAGIEVWAVGPAGSPLAAVRGLSRSAFGQADAIDADPRRARHRRRVAPGRPARASSSSTISTPSRTPR